MKYNKKQIREEMIYYKKFEIFKKIAIKDDKQKGTINIILNYCRLKV